MPGGGNGDAQETDNRGSESTCRGKGMSSFWVSLRKENDIQALSSSSMVEDMERIRLPGSWITQELCKKVKTPAMRPSTCKGGAG